MVAFVESHEPPWAEAPRWTHDHARSITLDANGVLLVPDPSFLRRVLAMFDCEPDDQTCIRAHFEVMCLLDAAAEPDYDALHRSFAGSLGVPPQHLDSAGPMVAEVYRGTPWVPAPGAVDALRRLATRGYRMAVVSNTVHGGMEALLDRTGLCSVSGSGVRVAAVLDSEVVGLRKPDRRIFEMAIAALRTTPDDCLHVGDSVVDDVRGARAAGLTPVHVDPLGLCSDRDHVHTPSLAVLAFDLTSDRS
jgi:putative hydrolase of the HAD superfamily